MCERRRLWWTRSFICLIGILAAVWVVAFALGRCGDGNCDGPETATLCPEDCAGVDLDSLPNPLRAIVSEDILVWRNWLDDGGFEAGENTIELLPHPAPRLAMASAERTTVAARTGDYGIRVESGPNEGMLLAIRSSIEKGEETRYSFWTRSGRGSVDLRLSVLGVESSGGTPRTLYEPQDLFRIGEEWTKIEFTHANTHGIQYALLAIDVGPNVILDVDDAAIEAAHWGEPTICRLEREVGGIQVPLTPEAPFHFNVLIHIEDPRQLTSNEFYFREQTVIFTELARILHEHGGFLTIQPEEDWPMGSLKFAPGTLRDLSTDYGVVYSTHTHGPACIDPDGRLRSNADCNDCRTCPDWTTIETDQDPTTPKYVSNLRELLSEASGTAVTDHNGNFHYSNPDGLAEAGIATWSAYKNHNTQATFDQLYTNPWRPTPCDAIESPEVFQTHDPATDVIFLPGWGQAITRHPERIHDRLAAMLGQILCYADPDRVNSFYIVTHVGHYRADGEPYIEIDEQTGELTYHEAFLQDLAYWEETLTELIDPLVAEGYLTWSSLPEVGELYVEWEEAQERD